MEAEENFTTGSLPDPRGPALALVDDLLAALELEIRPSARASLLCKAAEVYERRLGDADSALVTLQAAFREDPRSGQVVQEMERLARLHDRWREVVASTAEIAQALPDPHHAADLWVQIAFWCDVGLINPAEAIAAAQRALNLVSDHGGALVLLESLYRRGGSWDRLCDVLDQRWRDPQRDPNRIADAYAEILRADPGHLRALMGLGRVNEALGDWDSVIRLLSLAADKMVGEDRVSLHFQLGEVALAQLGDPAGAEQHYAQAVALDPGHLPSILALVPIYRERNDWLKAAQALIRAADLVGDRPRQIELLYEAGTIYLEKLDDEAQAATLLARVVALAPEHAGAALPLMEIYFHRKAWNDLRPLAENLADAGPGRDQPRGSHWQATVCHRLGRAAQALGDIKAAVAAYSRSYSADLGYLPTLRDWGDLAFEMQDWGQAAPLYDAVLFPRRESPTRDQLLEALYRLGVCRLHLGEAQKAATCFERALGMDPGHRPTLEALVQVHTHEGAWDALIEDKRALLAQAADADLRQQLHEQLADIFHDRKHDAERAIAECSAALEIKPGDHRLMHKLLDLFTETRQWARALPLLTRLADGTQGAVRARYLVAAGNVQNYELGSIEEAVELYNQALDEDPDDLKTFERIDRLLTGARDWKNQARCYRRQIKRMGPPNAANRPALLALWSGLGEIARSRQNDYPTAIAAFEVCAGLEPEALERRMILAELYRGAGAEQFPKAIDEHRFLLKKAASTAAMIPHLKLMLRLHAELGELDSAWCVAQALGYLGQADGDEQRLFMQYRPPGFVRPHSRLTEELWQKQVYHRDEDRVVSPIFATIAPTVTLARAKPHKDWGLKRKRQRDVANDPALFCKVLAYASQILTVPWPEVHLVTDASGEIELANTIAESTPVPSFVVGRGVLQGRHETEIAFIAGRALTLSRPDHLLLWPSVVPAADEWEVILLAAITLVDASYPVPAALAQAVLRYRDFLGRTLPAPHLEQLDLVVKRATINADTTFDLPRWAQGAQRTAARAGLLICNDLHVAAPLARAATGPDGAAVERDLIEWSVSREYAALRQHLGYGPRGANL